MPDFKQTIWMADVPVVEVKGGQITINIGNNVFLTIHAGEFPHTVKTGDTIPLYTQLPFKPKDQVNGQSSEPSKQ